MDFQSYSLSISYSMSIGGCVDIFWNSSVQNGLPVIVVSEFGAFKMFMQNNCFAKPAVSYFLTGNVKNRSYLDLLRSYRPNY